MDTDDDMEDRIRVISNKIAKVEHAVSQIQMNSRNSVRLGKDVSRLGDSMKVKRSKLVCDWFRR